MVVFSLFDRDAKIVDSEAKGITGADEYVFLQEKRTKPKGVAVAALDLDEQKVGSRCQGMQSFERRQTLKQKLSFPFQPTLGLGREARVLKTRQRHIQCWAIDGPGFLIRRELSDSAGFPEQIAEPKSRQGIVLCKRAQNY